MRGSGATSPARHPSSYTRFWGNLIGGTSVVFVLLLVVGNHMEAQLTRGHTQAQVRKPAL